MRRLFWIALLIAVPFVWYWAAYPSGSATAKVTATIETGGQQLTSSAVWRVSAQTLMRLGTSSLPSSKRVEGDAIEFHLSPTETIFMQPNQSVLPCWNAPQSNTANALSSFSAACDVRSPHGTFVFARGLGDNTPSLQQFSWSEQDGARAKDSARTSPTALPPIADSFRIVSVRIEPTDEPLGGDMISRYPWILQLARNDYRNGRKFDGEVFQAGVIYAQAFTTLLP